MKKSLKISQESVRFGKISMEYNFFQIFIKYFWDFSNVYGPGRYDQFSPATFPISGEFGVPPPTLLMTNFHLIQNPVKCTSFAKFCVRIFIRVLGRSPKILWNFNIFSRKALVPNIEQDKQLHDRNKPWARFS